MTTITTGTATPANLGTTLANAITGKEGWTTSGYSPLYVQRVTPAPGSNYLGIYFGAATNSTLTCTVYDNAVATNSGVITLVHGTTTSAGLVSYFISHGPSHLVIQLEGPAAGQAGAYGGLGSPKQTLILTEMAPFDPADTGNTAVCIAGSSAATNNPGLALICDQPPGVNSHPSTVWRPVELICAAGSVASQIATETGPTGTMVFPYDVVDSRVGPRGRLRNVYRGLEPALGTTNLRTLSLGGAWKHPTEGNFRAIGADRSDGAVARPLGATHPIPENTAPGLPTILIPEA